MVLFLAGGSPIFNFEWVQNFIFYVQGLVTASDWAKGLCSHRGCKDKRAAEVSRLGLKTGTGTRSSVFAFVGAYGIFTSVKLDISWIYRGYIADICGIYCCKLWYKI